MPFALSRRATRSFIPTFPDSTINLVLVSFYCTPREIHFVASYNTLGVRDHFRLCSFILVCVAPKPESRICPFCTKPDSGEGNEVGRGLHLRGHGKHRRHAGRLGGRPPGLGGVVHHRRSGGRTRGKHAHSKPLDVCFFFPGWGWVPRSSSVRRCFCSKSPWTFKKDDRWEMGCCCCEQAASGSATLGCESTGSPT